MRRSPETDLAPKKNILRRIFRPRNVAAVFILSSTVAGYIYGHNEDLKEEEAANAKAAQRATRLDNCANFVRTKAKEGQSITVDLSEMSPAVAEDCVLSTALDPVSTYRVGYITLPSAQFLQAEADVEREDAVTFSPADSYAGSLAFLGFSMSLITVTYFAIPTLLGEKQDETPEPVRPVAA